MFIEKVKDVNTPLNSSINNCGYDLFIPNDFEDYILKPNKQIKIKSGLKFCIPDGYGLFAFERSSVGMKGLKCISPVIDPNYRGEISICVFNYSDKNIRIMAGQRLIQVVLLPYIKPKLKIVRKIPENTDRNDKGFGSSGI